ncbi:Zinc finger, C2H2 type [Nesidiocoris tenuis]|uniref:Zinc finger, C2H2 type n=1 Tax=Nesidiocoris tenuis TaxID=355587 RepID=A0ABN7ACV2_9HEMI|nr:Zinc finger, C2H2 type [Nesidiocoris tenuis]
MSSLYDSKLCRLCANPNSNGISLDAVDDKGRTNYALINRYLPLKVENDGYLPRTVCSGCYQQLQNIIDFFNVLIKGQSLLLRLCQPNDKKQGILDKQRLYDDDCDISKAVPKRGDQGTKRKRGRPRKDESKANVELEAPVMAQPPPIPTPVIEEPEDSEPSPDGKRRRKKPARFLEAIQGEELEKALRETGVDDDDLATDDENGDFEGNKEAIGHVQDDKGETIGSLILCTSLVDSRKKLQFRCDQCELYFPQESKFVEHSAEHRLAHSCQSCSATFKSSHELEKHQRDSTACAAHRLDDDSILSDGLNLPAVETSPHTSCPICQKTFRFAANLKTHMKSDHEGVGGFPCDVCGKKLKCSSSLVYHKEVEHSNDRKFVCLVCQMVFKHRRLLLKHRNARHSQNERLQCPECNKEFKSKSYFNVHMQSHGSGRKFSCDVCYQVCSHRSALQSHIRTHTGEKPFECHVCEKTFTQKGNLREHLRTHTGERPFKCDRCDRAFTTSSQRRLHLKRHEGAKPFECEICLKAFLHKDTFVSHMRRHTGERPYTCEKCKKSFTELAAMRKHVRIHTGEKPYKCKFCSKAFSDSSNLTRHHRTHKVFSDSNGIFLAEFLPEGISVDDLTLAEASNDKQFWTVMPNASDDNDGDSQQVIYISYNNPDDPNSKVSETLLVGKDRVIFNKDNERDNDEASIPNGLEISCAGESLSSSQLTIPTSQLSQPMRPEGHLPISASPLLCAAPPGQPDSSEQHTEPVKTGERQVVMDEHGNPLRFTTADGAFFQVTTVDGASFQLTSSDGSSMPVRITTADGETLTPAGVNIPSLAEDVPEDALVSATVDSLTLVGSSEVSLLSEAALDFLPLG